MNVGHNNQKSASMAAAAGRCGRVKGGRADALPGTGLRTALWLVWAHTETTASVLPSRVVSVNLEDTSVGLVP